MNAMMFVSMVYLSFLIGIRLLFKDKLTYLFMFIYVIVALANILLIKYTTFFLLFLYFLQCYYLYLKVENVYLAIVLDNFLISCVGLVIFLTVDIPRYFGIHHVYFFSMLGVVVEIMVFSYIKYLDRTYHIFDYFAGYTKKMKLNTILFTTLMGLLYLIHARLDFYSLDYVLTSIIMIGFNLFSSISFIVLIVNRKREKFVSTYLKDFKETKAYYEKLDEFRHDYLNFITALEYGITNQSTEEAQKLVEHFKNYSLERIEDARHHPMKKINDSVIKGLLYDFIEKAEKKHLTYDIQVLNMITTVDMDSIDLIRLLSIALNNAIEHYVSSDQTVPIKISLDEVNDMFVFSVENPANLENSGDLSLLLKRGHSEKKRGGLGLHNFSWIVSLYENVSYSLRYDKQSKVFELELIVSSTSTKK
ncbi:GHKL domain-containing protein [Enterococcus ratti]|uniref:GHKL domain-containing protein n=1 Tax=Enterococcus ratti TaxID=150033 RepID=UPI00351686CA